MKTRIIGAIAALILAVVGAFALITYVRGADARAADGAELADVYIVQESIPEGTAGDGLAEFVKVDSVPARNVAEGTVTNLEDLAGLVADADLLPGEQLLEARFIDPLELAARGDVPVPEGMQQVSFALPVQRMAGGLVKAGSTVGIVVTAPTPAPSEVLDTRFEFHRVLVTDVTIGTTASSGGDESSSTPQSGNTLMFTVALGTHDVERLVWSLEHAEKKPDTYGVWVTLQNEATDTSGAVMTNESNVRQ
ncbi:Flp pilus assembly protein CpaB [Agromyces humatus]|uniref:Pilus assembly protein CpaB n=1 Tax=Agromyces humatus TaxID=279573 RepID=A0ABP4X4D5_9MICO|nr:Flp pilus assembly protein CpaB [Agromyces humatus]